MRLLVCAVTLGRVFHCSEMMQGGRLVSGFDSHLAPSCLEYVLFNAAQVLPVMLVHLQPKRAPRAAAPEPPRPVAAELLRCPKSNIEFYLGAGRRVLEMAPVDDDDDESAVFGDAEIQMSRYRDD